METKIMDAKSGLSFAASLIQSGQLVAFPTETVYGLGANALDADACRDIFLAKGRPADNPLIVHIPHRENVDEMISTPLSELVNQLLEAYWPGPLTIVVPASGVVPLVVRGGLDTVAIRCPDHPVAQALMELSARPIAAPSANRSGRPSPTTAEDVYEDLMGRIPLILDAGCTVFGLESTVVDVTRDPPVLLRPGAITRQQLEEFLGPVVLADNGTTARAPGMKYRHYAPSAPVWWWNTSDVEELRTRWDALEKHSGRPYALLASQETQRALRPALFYNLGDNDRTVAQNMFHGLRTLDRYHPAAIIVCWAQSSGLGEAILNRLRKAAELGDAGDADGN